MEWTSEIENLIEELTNHKVMYDMLSQNRATRIGNINAGKSQVAERVIYRLKEILKASPPKQKDNES